MDTVPEWLAIAAGNYTPEEGFCGAAPEAMLIIVKVKQAKKYLREFYLFPSQAELFQENDIMMGMDFAVRMANERKLPLSVCLGIGSSSGRTYWEKSAEYICGLCFCVFPDLRVCGCWK